MFLNIFGDRRDHSILRVRKSQNILGGIEGVPEEIIPHLELTGFIGVTNLSQFPLDVGLITALVERWRAKTHTFHMPLGECIITLQDVAILLGLCIDDRSVIAPTRGDWAQIVKDNLGIRLGPEHFVGSFLKMS
ncbi:serine/threonine-protein phosphatase 7 long form homolog [Abrus precatorius]|uniref:Serine/threonine-protein phosphatase 7 long form homolog n=1 Tax=Abrus precatorius TaxID=3816 RepID=A0A8B8M3Y0_ABRPR|nr:serine/threonine-protein phosphatase 7 long form homolog [Abrus precatorius]